MKEETIFGEALRRNDPAERAAYLDQACAGDEALRLRVVALLRSHEEAGEFLRCLPAGATADAGPAPAAEFREQAGCSIGPYKLVQQIGEGGMGVVWMAEQTAPVRRVVALKVIRAGRDGGQVVARFEAERQALALMDHPNIARVLDAGATPGGQPYFVMELIKGVPITRYCDERRLSLRDRLALFVPVCQAVQHAHQKGVIHRDLKPSNVLVALYDGRPVPKVIDFGVAKATEQRLTEKTLVTGFGALVGTLEYMSPEQAELNQLDVDTRSDVYSLGVLLYELLTGTTPLDRGRLGERAILELLLRIREEDPPTPSTRLGTSAQLPILSEQRQTEPAKLTRLVRGELDWIVMRALEKDRGRRYETAAIFGQDVERYLRDEPVQAGPPGTAYRLRKFVKRHRGAVLAATTVLLALVLGVAATSWGLARALQAEQQALEARDAEAVQRQTAEQEADRARLAEEDARQKARAEVAARQRAEKGEEDARTQALEAETARHAIRIELALRAWEQHDVSEAERILNEVGKAFRDTWETRYLRGLCVRKARPLEGMALLGMSGDGRRMLARDKNRRVIVCELPSGKELSALARDTYWAAMSKDGRRAFWLDAGGTTRGWDVAAGRELFAIKGTEADRTNVAAVSGDGSRFATARPDRTVRVWDGQTGKVLQTLRGHAAQVKGLALSGDGKRVASSADEINVKVWDVAGGQLLFNLPQSSGGGANSLALSVDGGIIVTGGNYQNVAVWDGKTGQRKVEWRGHGANVNAVALSPDGRRVLTGGTDFDGLKVWDAQTGKELHVLRGHGFGYIHRIDISDDGRRIASSDGGLVRVWDETAAQEQQLLGAPRGLVGFSGDGEHLLFGAFHSVVVRNLATGKDVFKLPLPPAWFVHSTAVSPDGKRLAVGGRNTKTLNYELKVWDMKENRELFVRKGRSSTLLSVQFSHNGDKVLSGDADGTVKVWEAATGLERLSIKCPGTNPRVAFSPDDRRIVAVGDIKEAGKVWDASSGREVLTLQGTPELGVKGLAISRDGRWLAGGAWDKTVRVWDLRTGIQKHCIRGHQDGVGGVAFSPVGTRLVSFGQDRLVKMWDTRTGQLMLTFKVPPSTFSGDWRRAQNVAFSPDGKRLAWASWDRTEIAASEQVESTTRVWEAP